MTATKPVKLRVRLPVATIERLRLIARHKHRSLNDVLLMGIRAELRRRAKA